MRLRAILERFTVATLFIAVVAAPIPAQTGALVDFHDLGPQELRSAAFILGAPQAITIQAVGAEPRPDRDESGWRWGNSEERTTWPAAAWIIDARTRAVVWDFRTADTERSGKGLRRFSGTVRLPAGVYEAYFGSFVATSVSYQNVDVGDFVSRQRARRNGDVRYRGPYVDDGSYRQFGLQVRGLGRPASAEEVDSAGRAFTRTAIVSLRPGRPGAAVRTGFALSRSTAVEIYAIGELRHDGTFDYGWIQDADTRRRVWEMEYPHTVDAGGAHKNRMVRDTIRLRPGRYVAYFVSDDSHDPEEWNAVPPADPEFWGLTLRVADPAARAAVRSFAWEPVPDGQALVSLIGVGDDELRSAGFTLRRPMDVRVYALGEGSTPHGDMDDYAWIVDAATRRRVWTMRYDDTEHAGGAEKNRLFDGSLRLTAGSYLVYYKSDGSHSYRKWNAAAPAESRYWGVSVFPASGRLDSSAIAPFARGRDHAIAELVRMGDDEHARANFALGRPTTIRIYALGEATGRELADYGWIENAQTGIAVWEMTYRMTGPAGGAEKNRLFDGTIQLPAGRYVLHYQSDGSHAYGDWNADPPDDPESWGITLLPGRTP
jgi:hypothetical protein